MIRAVSVTALLFLLVPPAGSQTAPSTGPGVSGWRQDIDEIVRDIRVFHPNPFTKVGELTFLRQAEALKNAVPSLTEEQRVAAAMRLVASLGDGHTQLEPDSSAFAFWYPIRIYEFTDGFFVTSAHKSVSDLAGAQVLEIAGHPASEVVAEARKLMGADNVFHRKEKLYAVHSAALMKGLGYTDPGGQLKIKFRLRDGRVVERDLVPTRTDDPAYKGFEAAFEWQFRREMFGVPFGKADDWISAYSALPSVTFRTVDTSRPPHFILGGPYVSRAMPQHHAYYVQMNQLDDTELIPFLQAALREVDQLRPRRLILDLRYNFGGDGSVVNDMIAEFITRQNHPPWTELYILTGRKTFSAGIMALSAFLKHTRPTLIGEPAGAALNSFGDATSRKYSRTGLHLYVSTLRHQLSASNDLSEFIPVDLPAPFSFADYAAGRDPALDPILRGEEMRSIPVIALANGGVAARRAYEDRKARFASYDWWRPPPEIDLRNACQMLMDQKRMPDALETCRLNADIHPYIWNVWLNLGRAQRLSGMQTEALKSYRRVLEVDPNNFNAHAICPLLAKASMSDGLPVCEAFK